MKETKTFTSDDLKYIEVPASPCSKCEEKNYCCGCPVEENYHKRYKDELDVLRKNKELAHLREINLKWHEIVQKYKSIITERQQFEIQFETSIRIINELREGNVVII